MNFEMEYNSLPLFRMAYRKGCREGGNCREDYEIDLQVRFREHVGRGGSFIDIGGNYGFYSLLAKAINPRIPVFYFDPNPYNFTCFQESVRINNMGGVVPYCCAVGDTFETVQFSGSDWYTNSQLTNVAMGQPVTVVPLDVTPAAQGRVGMIKIDAEGCELKVLNGASLALRHRPALMIEFCPEVLAEHGSVPFSSLQFLEDRHYSMEHCYIDRPNLGLVHRTARESMDSFTGHNTWISNLFCLPT